MLNFKEFNGFYHDVNVLLLEKFNYELINEGLIKSAEYDFAVNKINNFLHKFKLKGNAHIYPANDRIQLDIYGVSYLKNKRDVFGEFKSLLYVLGYYISNYSIEPDGKSLRKDITFEIFDKNDSFCIWINKLYDAPIGVPVELFHITYKRHLDKIKRQGLVPKTKNLIEKHPERIYLFYDEDDAKNYTVLRDLYSDEDSDFVLLKIDTRLLKNIKLYEDPKFWKDILAYYTYDNIPPNAISLIEEL